MDKSIVINGVPAAWAYPLVKSSGQWKLANGGATPAFGSSATEWTIGTGAVARASVATDRFLFDNISAPKVKLVRPESATTTEEFLEIVRADNGTIQFPKSKVTLDGTTGLAKSGSSSSSNAKGEISFVANEADIDAYEYITYMQKLNQYLTSNFLVCVPLGLASTLRDTANDVNAAGYAYIVGKLNADPEHAVDAYSPAKITYTFLSTTLDATLVLPSPAQLPAILVPEGFDESGADPDERIGKKYKPLALTTTDITNLQAGKVVLK